MREFLDGFCDGRVWTVALVAIVVALTIYAGCAFGLALTPTR